MYQYLIIVAFLPRVVACSITTFYEAVFITREWSHVLEAKVDGLWRSQLEKSLGTPSLEHTPEISYTGSPRKGYPQYQKDARKFNFYRSPPLPPPPLK